MSRVHYTPTYCFKDNFHQAKVGKEFIVNHIDRAESEYSEVNQRWSSWHPDFPDLFGYGSTKEYSINDLYRLIVKYDVRYQKNSGGLRPSPSISDAMVEKEILRELRNCVKRLVEVSKDADFFLEIRVHDAHQIEVKKLVTTRLI